MAEKISLSDGEWKLMNLLWDENPQTIGRMVDALRHDTGWTKATVNIMLNRLAEKGAVRIETGGRSKLFYPVLDREQAVRQEAKSTLEKIRTGGIGLLISTIAGESDLTKEDVEELYRILKGGIKDD
ncbi:MAG: BlaI/MecI/CopY family transcriptional regulator [Clostridia bacterium]|nr:BlaI/MecI/CopY family transcriptional regulator [Clostridia bacterium]MBR6110164.1 BlaI/MecI/CopY family transcriptional regulator [Clostridia bacterium]